MQQQENDTIRVIKSAQTMQYALVLNGLLVGVAAGGVAVVYRLMLGWAEDAMRAVFAAAHGNILLAAAWFVVLAGMALLTGWMVKAEPMISGSGIPQVGGEIRGYLSQSWPRVILGKLVSGTVCILGGLSLGREGPSVQLGAMAGKGLSRLLHRVRTEEKYLITCGAGARLWAAIYWPPAGKVFFLGEGS